MNPVYSFEYANEALEQVVDDLFGVAEPILFKIAEDRAFVSTLPDVIKVEISRPRCQERIEAIRAVIEQFPTARPLTNGPAIVRREKGVPRPGDIRVVDGVDLNFPQQRCRYTEALLVLIDEPCRDPDGGNVLPGLWWAWITSRFTNFASWWDVVFEGEEQLEACAMVHAWNRVLVSDQHLGGLACTMQDHELKAVRAVWKEYACGDDPGDAIADCWGDLNIRETLHGIEVVTGTPLRAESDPRNVFQALFARAEEILTNAAHQVRVSVPAVAPKVAKETWTQLMVRFVNHMLPPSPMAAQAANTPSRQSISEPKVLIEFEDAVTAHRFSLLVIDHEGEPRVVLKSDHAELLVSATELQWFGQSFLLEPIEGAMLLDERCTTRFANKLCQKAAESKDNVGPCLRSLTPG